MSSAPSTTVMVEVPVPCIALTDVPPVPAPTPTPATGLREKTAALLADLESLEKYAGRADALLRSCTTLPKDKP